MANQDRHNAAPPKREPVAYRRRRGSLIMARHGVRGDNSRYLAAYQRLLARHERLIRRVGIGLCALAAVLLAAFAGVWWRLSSGPIQLDVFTPWLASAIEENFGSRDRVEVGGTQIERTESGGAAVRIRDIVVRDPAGEVVARAPKAEVRVSALSLLTGHIRAESLNLVGAQLNVRIEPDGKLTVFAGADQHPIATATARLAAALSEQSTRSPPAAFAAASATGSPASTKLSPDHLNGVLAALLTWIDGIGKSGLDGHDLRELGLKEGALRVDDQRTGKDWGLANIRLSLERPLGGGVILRLGSENPKRPWALVASVNPIRDGARSIKIEAHNVPANGLLRALHLGDGSLKTTLPLSGSVRGEIGEDGVPRSLAGQIDAEAGSIGEAESPENRVDLDRAEFKFDWDPAARALTVPFQILSGGNQIALLGRVQAPTAPGGDWSFKLSGGSVVLAAPAGGGEPLVLRQIALTGSYDPRMHRLVFDDGNIGNTDVDVSMSGHVDYADGQWRVNAGLAGQRMSVDQFKQLWPVFVAPKVRDWFYERLLSGTVHHITIAVNAPLETLKAGGPPIPNDGLSVEATASDCVIHPVDGLPALDNADLAVHVVGRDAQVSLGKAVAVLPSGRTLAMSSGLFEVPDTAPHEPPARVRFKLDGPVPATAELLAMERLRDVARTPFDPATIHGTMSAQVALAMPLKPDLPPGSTNYLITVDARNFSADQMIMGQRLDAQDLHVSATPQEFHFNGNVKIAGAPATLYYRQTRGDSEADVRISGSLDAAARKGLGFDRENAISGSIPVRLMGRVGTAPNTDRNGRFTIAADLTTAQIEDFLPGWVKPAGKPAHATLTLTTSPQSIRIDDLKIDGAGDGVKGTIDLDGSGQLRSADFSSYGFSEGDRAALTAERTPDGTLHVTMRGDVYDGRGFLKSLTGRTTARDAERRPPDVNLDVKLAAMLAYNGEALSGVHFKMSRRAGEFRNLSLSAKIGHDGKLDGELRGDPDGRQVVVLRTSDAGALFRATDVYKRMIGGQMAITMEAPSPKNAVQQGTINVRNFTIHDEAELQRAANGAAASGTQVGNNLQFSSMRVDFTRAPGRISLRDGVARGAILGGTMDGLVDYTRSKVDLRGTLVPLYGANNLFGWLPVVGPILGGSKEGLVGFTYQVVGKPGNPVLNVNLLSGLAPGVLRKIFEYPAATDTLGGR
jgi:hypothetical protein